MAKQATLVLNCVGPVSNQPFFVSEQTNYSFLAKSGILYSRGKHKGRRQKSWFMALTPHGEFSLLVISKWIWTKSPERARDRLSVTPTQGMCAGLFVLFIVYSCNCQDFFFLIVCPLGEKMFEYVPLVYFLFIYKLDFCIVVQIYFKNMYKSRDFKMMHSFIQYLLNICFM